MEKAILIGPMIGELGWEVLRFAPHFIWLKLDKYRNTDTKFIVYTREDRFDLYGLYADIFVPLRIEGDGSLFKPNCFRLDGFKFYEKIKNNFFEKYSQKFNILEHVYPKIDEKHFQQKGQFQRSQMKYDFLPRVENIKILEKYLNINKKNIIIAPRFREGIRRNWHNWEELYELIHNSNLIDEFNFIICGKAPDYIPDTKNKFLDINNIKIDNSCSLIGLTMAAIKKSCLTVGSQSGIPNLSLLLKTPVLEWGHQKELHSKNYNILNTKILFLEDIKYKLSAKIIFEEMKKMLNFTHSSKGS